MTAQFSTTVLRRAGMALLATCCALLLFPLAAAAQTPAPSGVFVTGSATGAPGSDRTLLALNEDGRAVMAFINMDEAISDIYPGTWLLDPYGTVTVVLEPAPAPAPRT